MLIYDSTSIIKAGALNISFVWNKIRKFQSKFHLKRCKTMLIQIFERVWIFKSFFLYWSTTIYLNYLNYRYISSSQLSYYIIKKSLQEKVKYSQGKEGSLKQRRRQLKKETINKHFLIILSRENIDKLDFFIDSFIGIYLIKNLKKK